MSKALWMRSDWSYWIQRAWDQYQKDRKMKEGTSP